MKLLAFYINENIHLSIRTSKIVNNNEWKYFGRKLAIENTFLVKHNICKMLLTQTNEYLNLQQSATNEEIKKNYHKLAKKWHPDKNGNLEALERFKLIKNAYEVLNNEASRREYDNLKFQEPQSMKKEQTPKKETDERIFNIFTNSWQFKTQMGLRVRVRVNKFYIENSLKELMNNEISLIFH